MDGTLLHVESLYLSRGDFEFGPVDLTLSPGMTVLLGRNGAGKTSLIETIVGIRRPRAGSVSLGGLDPHRGRTRKAFMRAVGFVPQDAGLPAPVIVRSALDYAAWLKGVPRAVVARRSAEILDALEIGDLGDRKVGTLSGGERRRVSIAAALLHEPALLILDEPTVGLDPVQRLALRRILLGLATERTLLVSTHLVGDLTVGVDRVLALGAGRLVFDGSVADLESQAGPSDVGETALERGTWHVLAGGAR